MNSVRRANEIFSNSMGLQDMGLGARNRYLHPFGFSECIKQQYRLNLFLLTIQHTIIYEK
jgi:hypothetical protein